MSEKKDPAALRGRAEVTRSTQRRFCTSAAPKSQLECVIAADLEAEDAP
jgi:hypothetical protein